ncbi:uncharacterized protein LOC124407969 [Diprion similis]|uniref:uncharacterized protein LOC124407969 n=1 Tax=Diprion similis TaxID=362088 RepID=UPI001EF7BEC3|nr:uncharacterized protein LOC124407969 [Diprion similis]
MRRYTSHDGNDPDQLHDKADVVPIQNDLPTVTQPLIIQPEQPSAPGSETQPLCENILKILGNKVSEEKIMSKEVHPDIACRWEMILTKGLSPDSKSELNTKYTAPSNCTLMEAPVLNPEAKAAMLPNTIQRDVRLATGDNVQLIEWVSDAGRMLSDLHHTHSETRRLFITSSVNPSAKETMTGAPIGKFSFGNNLEERVNSAKSIEKISLGLKNNKPDYKKPENMKKFSLNSKSLPYFNRKNQQATRTPRSGRQQPYYSQQDTRRSSKPQGGQRFNTNVKQSFQSYRRKHSNPRQFLSEHLKMEDYRTARRLISHKCYTSTIDLQDAYFLISIHPEHRKYLRFLFENQIYEFTCFPFGLSTAPYVFTKIMRPVLNELRKRGLMSVAYIDDFLLLGNSYQSCQDNLSQTVDLLLKLGFLINEQKNKRLHLIKQLRKISITENCKIREFASFLGKITATCPALTYGWAYTKSFEKVKLLALDH